MTTPIVTMTGVGKTFPTGVAAVQRLDLSVRRGEFLALLGPSGCGKSTALRMIAGLIKPSSGSIARPGLERADEGRDLSIGFVFQEPTLMPWATVRRNVELPLKLAGRRKAEISESATAAIARVGLAEFADAYPRELSGGMRMRASIARSLVTRPILLLMDEPFAALDEITRFKLNDDLLRLRRTLQMTIVFVTHSVFESVYLADRILVMTPRPGRLFREITIEYQGERDAAFRRSPTYADLCGEASESLALASAGVN